MPVRLDVGRVVGDRRVERQLRNRPPSIVESVSVPLAVTSISLASSPTRSAVDVPVDRALISRVGKRRHVERVADLLQVEIVHRGVGPVTDGGPVHRDAGGAAVGDSRARHASIPRRWRRRLMCRGRDRRSGIVPTAW